MSENGFALEPKSALMEENNLKLPPLIIGGAGFSYQLHPKPEELPVLSIIKRAFELGVRAIDTSPYYEPSEQLLGAALSSPEITKHYARSDYFLMTKCGRLKANHFDYSPSWIKQSVERSLQRFNTTYLDVVFCHDIEFVTFEQALEAVGTLFQLKDEGVIRFVGISGYPLDRLASVAEACLNRYGRSVDVVQNWAQLSLQNTRMKDYLSPLRRAGVRGMCNASPLACGLLRAGGVPVGSLGDWHPAPASLRNAAEEAANVIASHGQDLAAVAFRYAVATAMQLSSSDFAITTITGVSHMAELMQNVSSASQILMSNLEGGPVQEAGSTTLLSTMMRLNQAQFAADLPLFEMVRGVLGEWIDYDFTAKKQVATKSHEMLPALKIESAGALPDTFALGKNGWAKAPILTSVVPVPAATQ